MPYVTSVERSAIQQGITQGITQGISQGITQGKTEGLIQAVELGLKLKFGIDGLKMLPEIMRIKDPLILETICSAIESAKTVDELSKIYKDG